MDAAGFRFSFNSMFKWAIVAFLLCNLIAFGLGYGFRVAVEQYQEQQTQSE